jgi:hypothetical protein
MFFVSPPPDAGFYSQYYSNYYADLMPAQRAVEEGHTIRRTSDGSSFSSGPGMRDNFAATDNLQRR